MSSTSRPTRVSKAITRVCNSVKRSSRLPAAAGSFFASSSNASWTWRAASRSPLSPAAIRSNCAAADAGNEATKLTISSTITPAVFNSQSTFGNSPSGTERAIGTPLTLAKFSVQTYTSFLLVNTARRANFPARLSYCGKLGGIRLSSKLREASIDRCCSAPRYFKGEKNIESLASAVPLRATPDKSTLLRFISSTPSMH